MAYIGPFPLKVPQGGTGEITLVANAVLIGENASDIAVTNVGTNGQLLIGATSGPPAFATLTSTGGTVLFTPGANSLNLEVSGTATGITTILGDQGTGATGSSVTIHTDQATSNLNGTPFFIANSSTSELRFSNATGNTIIGRFAGGLGVGGSSNVGLGDEVYTSSFSGDENTAIGNAALNAVTTGDRNVGVGMSAGAFITTGNRNINIGRSAGAGSGTVTGSYNVIIGDAAGLNYTSSESSNITLNAVSTTVAAESNVLRIGNGTGTGNQQLSKAFISGIDGVNVGSVAKVLTMASDQIGTATVTAGTGITVTPGANTITIATTGSTGGAVTFHTGSGDATTSGNAITMAGGNNISTSGSGATVTYSVSGTTNHAVQIGNSTGSLSSVSVGTNGQVLLGSTGADPSFVTPTAGTGLSITTNATTLQYALSTPVSVSNGGTGASSITAHSLILGQGTSAFTALGAATNGQIPIGSTGADPVLATITAGTGISVTNGAGTITIANTATGMTWTEVTGTSQSMAVNNGYILNNAGLVTATLPSTAAVGDVVRVTGKGAGGWRIAQNSGQTIFFGTSSTTTGTGGRLDSTATRDSVYLVCVTANNDWNVLSSIGNITVT